MDDAAELREADMVLVLSSELVCQIAEKYFNQTMLKKKVKVIDLQPTSNGLVQFNVAFVIEEVKTVPVVPSYTMNSDVAGVIPQLLPKREANGKFIKVKDHE